MTSGAYYTATIQWGDGDFSTGTVIAEDNGTFAVTGGHTYGAAGSYPIVVSIHGDESSITLSTTAAVDTPASPMSAPITIGRHIAGYSTGTIPVGSIVDSNAVTSDFTGNH